MKLTIDSRALADAVGVSVRALPNRPPVPVMAALKLHAGDGQLAVTGYNYDVSAYTTAAVQITEPGTVLVPGRILTEIARTLRKDVHLTTDDTRLTVESGNARFTLPTLPLGEYPTLPELQEATGTVHGPDFAEAVAQVAIAAGRDDTLPVLTGVQLDVEGPTITLSATDRYRFAARTLHWEPDGADWNGRALLPAKALLETTKALATDDTIYLTLADEDSGGSGVTGLTGYTQRTTLRGLEGKLPSYDALFPTEFCAEAVVPTEALADIVKRVALVAERNTPVRLAFTPGTVTIEAGSSDDAQAIDRADADYTDHTGGEHDTFRIAFNPHFLLDGLTALGSDAVRIRFTNPHKPALLTGDGAPETGLQYLLMPVRLSG